MRIVIAAVAILFASSLATLAQPLQPRDCWVKDGDTIQCGGITYRLVGFDAPETTRAKCAAERELGERAATRLRALMDQGELMLAEITCSCLPGTHGTWFCNWGRRCAVLTAQREDVGYTLVNEGLAREYRCSTYRCPRRRPWCYYLAS
jgi:endonuclease YncB( thermonuclease family)